MSITPNDPANFTPTMQGYTGQGSFRFWCQTVLPLVYDDSLSYYELLNKVVNYLNNVISDVSAVETNVGEIASSFDNLQGYVNTNYNQLVDAYNTLEGYVNDYFTNLDVQQEINTKLDIMANDGSLSNLLTPLMPNLVTTWLNEHVTPTSPVIDDTLSISGAGADAQKTGKLVANEYDPVNGTYVVGEYVNFQGAIYRCVIAIIQPESWTPSKWSATDVGEELTALNSDITNTRNGALMDFSSIEPYHTSFIDSIYQFCDNDNVVTGELWDYNFTTHQMYIVNNQSYARLPAFYLPKGDYTIPLTYISSGQTFLVDENGVEKFSTRFGVTGTFRGDFTLSKDTQIYITTGQSHFWVLLVNKNDQMATYNESYKSRGYYCAELKNVKIDGSNIENLPNENTVLYEQAFIKNGELTCNNDHLNASGSVAKYTSVDMESAIKKVMCRGKFRTLSTNDNITLIATQLKTLLNVQDIVQKSIHIIFSGTTCYVDTFSQGNRTTHATYTYTILANTEYEFGWALSGNTLTVYLPNGEQKTVTNSAFSDANGRYLIFEHFSYSTTPTTPVTDEFGQPVITGIYCTCADGLPLRDNFKRPGGLPLVATTGHVYRQFRNGAVSGDTVYDNATGLVN